MSRRRISALRRDITAAGTTEAQPTGYAPIAWHCPICSSSASMLPPATCGHRRAFRLLASKAGVRRMARPTGPRARPFALACALPSRAAAHARNSCAGMALLAARAARHRAGRNRAISACRVLRKLRKGNRERHHATAMSSSIDGPPMAAAPRACGWSASAARKSINVALVGRALSGPEAGTDGAE